MSLKYILARFGQKSGLDPNNANDRTVMLRFANEAAEEIYPKMDPDDGMYEQCFQVMGDQTISLPVYVGEIRAIRDANTMRPFHINKLRPRYNDINWADMWRNFRLKGLSALQTSVTNQSQIQISVPFVESPPIIVTVTGPTANASSISEDVVVNSTTVSTVNDFLDVTTLKKNTINTCDVLISDVDGKQLSVIPNNQLQAKYQIVDVSLFPFMHQPPQTNGDWFYLEVLYKKALPVFFNDDDEWIAPNFDRIIVNVMMQLWKEEQDKAPEALAYAGKAKSSMAELHEDRNRETEETISLVRHGHDNLLPKVRTGRRWYQRWRNGGAWY